MSESQSFRRCQNPSLLYMTRDSLLYTLYKCKYNFNYQSILQSFPTIIKKVSIVLKPHQASRTSSCPGMYLDKERITLSPKATWLLEKFKQGSNWKTNSPSKQKLLSKPSHLISALPLLVSLLTQSAHSPSDSLYINPPFTLLTHLPHLISSHLISPLYPTNQPSNPNFHGNEK